MPAEPGVKGERRADALVEHRRIERGEGAIVEAPAPEKSEWLLPILAPEFKGKKCLVLDLDETLVHSSFKVNKSTRIWL